MLLRRDQVVALLTERVEAKKARDYDRADEIRAVLKDTMSVEVQDDVMTWSVGKPAGKVKLEVIEVRATPPRTHTHTPAAAAAASLSSRDQRFIARGHWRLCTRGLSLPSRRCPSAAQIIPGYELFVGGVAPTATERSLKELFSKATDLGKVVQIRVRSYPPAAPRVCG